MSGVRRFDTGATRDGDQDKLDYEGFLSPLVLERFGEYMHAKRRLSDGTLRDSDNWQLGIPQTQYVKSAHRHFLDWWKAHRGYATRSGDDIEDEICALIFNAQGYLHELLKEKAYGSPVVLPHWHIDWGPGKYTECSGSVTSPHPMASETLREQDFARDDDASGV